MSDQGTFVKDIKDIRRRAREHLEQGALTKNYGADVATAIKLLNEAVATELVCVLRYKFHAVMATGIASEGVKAEFSEHAKEEAQHADWLAERIAQLGGKPDMNPEGLASRSTSEYVEGESMVDMIRENLVAERIAIETYRDMIHWFGDKDPTTRVLLERILRKEEEHANDMHDLLEAHDVERQKVPRGSHAPHVAATPPAAGIRQVAAGPVSGRAGGVTPPTSNGPSSRH
jgi:bacterioferritin